MFEFSWPWDWVVLSERSSWIEPDLACVLLFIKLCWRDCGNGGGGRGGKTGDDEDAEDDGDDWDGLSGKSFKSKTSIFMLINLSVFIFIKITKKKMNSRYRY